MYIGKKVVDVTEDLHDQRNLVMRGRENYAVLVEFMGRRMLLLSFCYCASNSDFLSIIFLALNSHLVCLPSYKRYLEHFSSVLCKCYMLISGTPAYASYQLGVKK